MNRILPFLLLAVLALGGCTREEVNARHQSGAWAIERVTTTFRAGTGRDSVVTVAGAGEVAFMNLDAIRDQATFYLDKAVPTRVLEPGQFQARPGTYGMGYQADNYDRHRVVLLNPRGAFGADIGIIFTLKDDGADRQTWQLLSIDNQDLIEYREEWVVVRQ